jgi:hypothetical protein
VEAHHPGEEVLKETHLDLGVGEVERINVANKVVILNGEVAALVEEGQSRGLALGWNVELRVIYRMLGRFFSILSFLFKYVSIGLLI